MEDRNKVADSERARQQAQGTQSSEQQAEAVRGPGSRRVCSEQKAAGHWLVYVGSVEEQRVTCSWMVREAAVGARGCVLYCSAGRVAVGCLSSVLLCPVVSCCVVAVSGS